MKFSGGSKTIELITPCVLAGAYPDQAELRVPSIRGILRWWFRAIGGTLKEEVQIFGGRWRERGKEIIYASSMGFRISDSRLQYFQESSQQQSSTHQAIGNLPCPKEGDPLYYLLYLAMKASNKSRWQKNGVLKPSTTFTLSWEWRKEVTQELKGKFDKALEFWLHLGALGLRSRRGLGAIRELSWTYTPATFQEWCERNGGLKGIRIRALPNSYSTTWKECLTKLSIFLKNVRRRYGLSGRNSTVLGYSQGANRRFASALHLRPVKVNQNGKDVYIPYIVYVPYPIPRSSYLNPRDINKIKELFDCSDQDLTSLCTPSSSNERRQ